MNAIEDFTSRRDVFLPRLWCAQPVSAVVMDSAECSPNAGFSRRFSGRLRTLWLIKMIGVSLGMTAFFLVYFRLLNHPMFPVKIVPLTVVDRFIGFWPGALPLYLSLWIYVSLAVALLKNLRELLSWGVAAVALSVIGLGIFFRWPTAVQNRGNDWGPHPWFSFLEAVDASGNACPSLHVAFAVFTAVHLGRLLREMHAHACIRAGNWAWGCGIAYSTLAVGQHVALDALAGALLGAIVAVPRISRSPSVSNLRPENEGI